MIGSMYKPPNLTNPDYFDDLSRTLNSIVSTNAHVWLAGDLNLPGIDWGVGAPQPKVYSAQCNHLLSTINDSGLSQMILEATRTDIIYPTPSTSFSLKRPIS